MKEVFIKTDFPNTPGGNIYHWQDADTEFEVPISANYVIAITASAKSAKQNNSTDDDDLRVIIDGFEFCTKEIHQEKVSWKGFGTSSSWDGASLKGETATIYFFLELSNKFTHKIQFWADKTPILKEIKIWEIQDLKFSLSNISPVSNIETEKKGIPWLSFVFMGARPEKFDLLATAKSADKNNTDGDNIKIILNGNIIQNKIAPTSKKYQNFYISGDLLKDKATFSLTAENFEFHENSLEFWYDQTPIIEKIDIQLNQADIERKNSIIKDTPIKIVVIENEKVDGNEPWSEFDWSEDVSDYKETYEKYAKEYGIDSDFVKSIAYLETTHSSYDQLYAIFGINKTILPMNINPSRWGTIEKNGIPLNYTREDLKDYDKNIKLGSILLKRIWDRVENPTIEKVATLYNNLNAFKISDYGVRVKKIYDEKPFNKE